MKRTTRRDTYHFSRWDGRLRRSLDLGVAAAMDWTTKARHENELVLRVLAVVIGAVELHHRILAAFG